MANDLTVIKQIIKWAYSTQAQIQAILSDKKITTFEALGIASIAIEAANLVKVAPAEIKKLKKLTRTEVNEIVQFIIADFKLEKNKPLQAQIIKTVRWVQSTYDMAEGWKALKN